RRAVRGGGYRASAWRLGLRISGGPSWPARGTYALRSLGVLRLPNDRPDSDLLDHWHLGAAPARRRAHFAGGKPWGRITAERDLSYRDGRQAPSRLLFEFSICDVDWRADHRAVGPAPVAEGVPHE